MFTIENPSNIKADRMKILIAAIFLSVVISSAATADWQYTKWGMSVEQVSKSSKGKAQPYQSNYNNAEYQAELIAPFQSGPFSFTATFEFQGSRGLAIVGLKAQSKADCASIETTLISKYGTSDPEARAAGAYRWDDRKGNNVVRFIPSYLDTCLITYKPLAARGGAGGL